MSTSSIEPGLLKVFRWYVGTRLGFSVLVLAAVSSERNAGDPRFPEAGVFFFGILMVLLVWPWVQRKLVAGSFRWPWRWQPSVPSSSRRTT